MVRIAGGLLVLLGGLLPLAIPVHAAPTALGVGAFSGAPIDSNVADAVQITTQLPAMTVSGGLFGNAAGSPFIPGGGALVTANFIDGLTCCFDITIDFSSPVVRFGMMVATNPEDDLTLTLLRGGVHIGSVDYTIDNATIFAGIQDLSGFDRVVIGANGSAAFHAFVADLFRFDRQATAVPAPAALVLLVATAIGSGALKRNSTKNEAPKSSRGDISATR